MKNKQNKQSYQGYKKMQKRHTKNLVKLAKGFRPFDWEYMHNMVLSMLGNVLEYYTQGNNVMQDIKEAEKIVQQVKEVFEQFEECERQEARVYRFIEENGIPYKGGEIQRVLPESYAEEFKFLQEEVYKLQDKAFRKGYQLIGKNLRKWWD